MLAARLAGRLVVSAGRDARPSRANVRHPAAAQLQAAYPFVLDGLPGTTPRRPRSVAVRGRAFGACCFAGKLRSPAQPTERRGAPGRARGRRPLRWTLRRTLRWTLRTPPAYPTLDGQGYLRWSCPRGGPVGRKNRGRLAPLRGSGAARPNGALRAIDSSACPRSWRTAGPRRLRRHLSLPWLPRTVVPHGVAGWK
jgi:hypothetical protein